ncbi:hypothetical protein EV360DRAFT_88377 [Lentinula raphanica]|nr:hypothetical protein EV360DRAFT_88377 [Lentinula raphanica]
MFYDLRFIHLMIIGLILMSADSSPTPLPGSEISKIVANRKDGLSSAQSAKSAPPSDEAWAYMLGLLVKANPAWGTSTDEVVKAKFSRELARAIDQPGYLAVDISFMHDRGPLDESLLDKEHATRYSREVAGVEQKQESRLAKVMEKINWPFPLHMLWDRDWLDHPQTPLTVRYFYNAKLTGDHKTTAVPIVDLLPSSTKFSRSVTSLRLDQLSTSFFNNKKHAILHHITISGQKNPPCESWLLIALLTFTHFLSVDSNVIAAPLISKPWNDDSRSRYPSYDKDGSLPPETFLGYARFANGAERKRAMKATENVEKATAAKKPEGDNGRQ